MTEIKKTKNLVDMFGEEVGSCFASWGGGEWQRRGVFLMEKGVRKHDFFLWNSFSK